MPYVTSVERFGIKRGLEQGLLQGWKEGRQEGRQEGHRAGLLEGIETALAVKFPDEGTDLLPEIRGLTAVSTLQAVLASIKSANCAADVRRAMH